MTPMYKCACHHTVAKPPVTGAANIGFDGQKSNEVFLQFSGRSLRFHLKDQQESPPHHHHHLCGFNAKEMLLKFLKSFLDSSIFLSEKVVIQSCRSSLAKRSLEKQNGI